MSDSNKEELIAQFVEITGSGQDVAKFYLDNSNWSVQDALSNFLGNQSENQNFLVQGNTMQEESSQDNENDGFGLDRFNKPNNKTSNFATLNNMEHNKSDADDGQAFYAGGSERSGQQVLGPSKKKNFKEQLTDMFRMAQELNNQDLNMSPTSSGTSGWGQGQGVRLSGNSTLPSSIADNNDKTEKKSTVVLKLWNEGFSVNDGELRQYGNAENKEFLETVMRGEIPKEFLKMGWMVNVDIEDHRHEDFKKINIVKKFKGHGHTLGSPAPNVEGCSTSSCNVTEQIPENLQEYENNAISTLNRNAEAPSTYLQIRLVDGTRLAAQFNLTHTISDVIQYIQNARPQNSRRNFILVTSFPTRELKDHSLTLEEADLRNAVVFQRFI